MLTRLHHLIWDAKKITNRTAPSSPPPPCKKRPPSQALLCRQLPVTGGVGQVLLRLCGRRYGQHGPMHRKAGRSSAGSSPRVEGRQVEGCHPLRPLASTDRCVVRLCREEQRRGVASRREEQGRSPGAGRQAPPQRHELRHGCGTVGTWSTLTQRQRSTPTNIHEKAEERKEGSRPDRDFRSRRLQDYGGESDDHWAPAR